MLRMSSFYRAPLQVAISSFALLFWTRQSAEKDLNHIYPLNFFFFTAGPDA